MHCLGETEYGEKGQRNFLAVAWQSISRDVGQAAAQNNLQCQWVIKLRRTSTLYKYHMVCVIMYPSQDGIISAQYIGKFDVK